MKNKQEILIFLNEIIKTISVLEGNWDININKKSNMLFQLKSIVEKNNFPEFTNTEQWYYKVEVTGRALYLNLLTNQAPYNKFNMITVTGELLTIDQYATMHGMTPVVVRKHILAGRLPYAFKAGSNWLIPSMSVPIKEKDLNNGWFVINELPEESTIVNEIQVKVGDKFTINVLKRDENNKRRYQITHIDIEDKKKTYIWGIDEKNKLLNILIKNPGIQYHSNDRGLGTWLYNR